MRTVEIDDDAPGASTAARAGVGLRVNGLLVAKADLIEALRAIVPGLVDISMTDDGEHFALMLGRDSDAEVP